MKKKSRKNIQPVSGFDEETIQFLDGPSVYWTEFDGTAVGTIEKEIEPEISNTVPPISTSHRDFDTNESMIREFKEIVAGNWDDNRDVVRSYVEDIRKLKDKRKARALLDKALKNGAPFTQRLASLALSEMGKPGVEILIKNLLRKNGDIHPDVSQSLIQLGKHVVPIVIDIMQEKSGLISTKQRLVLIRFIGQFKSAKTSAFLSACLADKRKEIRQEAFIALKNQGTAAEKFLLKLLRENPHQQNLRKNCIYLLGLMRSERALPHMIASLEVEEKASILCLLAWAIGEIGAPEVEDHLLYLLENKTYPWIVHRSVIRALGVMGSYDSVDAIIPFLDSRELRESCIEALGRIGSKEAVNALKPFLDSPIKYLRYLTITALARIGDRKSLKLMLDGLSDPDDFVARSTYKALESIYNEEEIEFIYDKLEAHIVRKSKVSAWQRLLGQTPPVEHLSDEALLAEEDFDDDDLDEPFEDEDEAPVMKARKPSVLERFRQKIENKMIELREQVQRQQNPWGQPPGRGGYDYGGPGGANPFMTQSNRGGQDDFPW